MRAAVWSLPLALIACSSTPIAPIGSDRSAPVRTVKGQSANPALPAAGSGRGGYYQDDGPGNNIPANLNDIPDAEPRIEPYAKGSNKAYSVFGKTYVPITDDKTPFKQRGVGSWYGKKFHGQKTASGERYDMYKMTAAHPTLPLPSYARVTNLKTGKQVIVRVNDRGPFHSNRIIDLSYTAALKLGYISAGSSELEVERLLPDEIARMNAGERSGTPTGVAQPVAVTPLTSASAAGLAALPHGFYLQFGAYSQETNAQLARTNLLQSLSGLVASLEAVPVNGLYRLYAGPYTNRTAAQEAAQQIRERSSVTPFLIENK